MDSEEITGHCLQLAADLSCDFVGIVVWNHHCKKSAWRYAVGSRNDKYRRITVRYGRGISGNVIKTGRAMIIQSFPTSMKGRLTEYPIMLAEQLTDCIAVPLMNKGTTWGVLLAGHRSRTFYEDSSIDRVKWTASQIQNTVGDDSDFQTEVVL